MASCIKGVNRSATVAFSPDSPYLAAGTMAGVVDLAFSSSANLEIFKIDFQSDDHELPVVGQCPSTERFHRISWGKSGSDTEQYSLGLIAGGLVDGSVNIWNPLNLLSSEESEGALVGRLQQHTGPVRGLEFSIHTPNRLASGSDDGEICIWDLANPAEPSRFPPLRGSGAPGEISFLSWNPRAQHILASTSYNGTTVVWDLKKQKQVISLVSNSFQDPHRKRCSVLQWNPEVATQLVVASDDDSSPSLQLWDLRSTQAPLREFVGHTKGVIAMSWCSVESSYLLTCAKDNRTICWDTVTEEIACELPVGTNWNYDIHWYPKIPGVISASSFDGKVGIYNIEACSRLSVGEGSFGASNFKSPKWMKRPVGVCFGFGGKFVSFHPSPSAAGAPTGNSQVYVRDLVTEQNLVNRSTEFEAAIQNGEKSSLRALCDKKSEDSKSEDDRETWGFLKVMFEEDGTARRKLLTHLGFNALVEENNDAKEELSEELNTISPDEDIMKEKGFLGGKELSAFIIDNGEDFFNNLQSPRAEPSVSRSVENFVDEDGVLLNGEHNREVEVTDSTFEDGILRALVTGDYKGAVQQCISANKMADALLIAHAGGASLWEATRDQYLKINRSSYLKVVSATVTNDLMSLVNSRPLNSWKETLALLCSFAKDEEWTVLCDSLAQRLMSARNTLAATLCFICAGNIEKTVEIWSRCLKPDHEGEAYIDLLQDLMEKTIVLALASGQKRFGASLSTLVENYAEVLASQGLLKTAMDYLNLLGSEEPSHELAILRDRVALSTEEIEASKSSQFGSAPLQTAIYGVPKPGLDVVDSHHYYQPQPIQHQQPQPSIPGSPYGDNYPPTAFNPSYSNPVSHQAPPPSQMFVPSAPVVSQGTFTPASSQPPVRPFNPATPPTLPNVEQYHQPPSLGSQLYPGVVNPTYQPVPSVSNSPTVPTQAGPHPVHKLPQVAAPTHSGRSFTTISNSGFAQRPGMSMAQPPSPTYAAQAAPAAQPAVPPPTVQTADTSNVPAQQRPVIVTLARLFNETSEALGGSRANPARKREIEDNSRKIGALFAKLNSGDISNNAAAKLVQLCVALDNGDFITALQIQVLLTTSEWDECNFWLATLKRMIKTRQNVR
ncbi:hypothetical protein GIB67_016130 [Kingdonia uniflora]|uniref:Sec16 Sec23-binding domain-containing protein n=1 Tax=Kingdonia uniflora TaxID=39325 RepID=A0A7J7L2A8_9MAGN|nr:hypothetical protein GIB67_016130 [Kingdonia uniflora]